MLGVVEDTGNVVEISVSFAGCERMKEEDIIQKGESGEKDFTR